MSTIPSRTRSLRKPADSESSRYGRPPSGTDASVKALQSDVQSGSRGGQSPSRLPVKPSGRNPSTSRPLSYASSTASNVSARLPPSRPNTSKPITSGLQRSTSNRVSNAAPSTEPIKQDRSRPPVTTTSRHLRNPSASTLSSTTRSKAPTHARTKSSSTILSASTLLPPPSRDDAVTRSGQVESQLRRPNFSTLQQHYSPAKSLAPKPHPAAFLAPPSPSKLPSNIAISAETAKLQNELLQLHLLHKDAGRVQQEWKASAKRKLDTKFQAVVDRNDALVGLEVKETAKINAAALRKWQDVGTPGWGLEEKIQVLDEVLTGIWNMGASGGKYAKVVRKFERWLSRCRDVLEAREREDQIDDGDEMLFLDELDAAWEDDCNILERKLGTWRAQLNDLGSPENGSSLATIIHGCRNLIRGMLTELSVMGQIERDAMNMEADWIKMMNDDVSDDENIPTVGAVWRSR